MLAVEAGLPLSICFFFLCLQSHHGSTPDGGAHAPGCFDIWTGNHITCEKTTFVAVSCYLDAFQIVETPMRDPGSSYLWMNALHQAYPLVMAQRRESAETTRQKDVAPGDKTGTYYITLCNLPFGTSWQELKDFTRTVCDVDHVEVFRTSTSGWVRVKGRANFDKAWKLLNGGHFNGRSIIASDRNKSHSIKIKELVDGSPEPPDTAQSLDQYGATPSSYFSTACRQQEQSYVAAYPHAQLMSYGDRPVMISEYRVPDSTTALGDDPVGHNSSGFYDAYNGPQAYGPYAMSWDRDAQYTAAGELSQEAFNGSTTRASEDAYFPTEKRQIVVTGFPRKARSDEVASWIRKRMGLYARLISRIDGPAEASKTAYVTVSSSATLRPGLEALESQSFQGNEIKAKMAKEGTPSPGLQLKSSSKTEKSSGSHRPKAKSSSPVSSSTKGSSSSRPKTPGSEKIDSGRKKGKGDLSRSVGGILIVDGSNGSRSVTEKEASKEYR